MIPRLKSDPNEAPPRSSWPADKGTKASALFTGRQPLRKLVVLVDSRLVEQLDEADWSQESLLAGLLTSDLIESFLYSDDGPPPDIPRQTVAPFGESVPGWAVLVQHPKLGEWPVSWSTSTSTAFGAVIDRLPEIAARDEANTAYMDLEATAAAERRRADAYGVEVARAMHADLFITDRPYLLQAKQGTGRGINTLSVRDALAIVGLYLRTQGVFHSWRSHDGKFIVRASKGGFFWIGARELLPSAWRWLAGCGQHALRGGDESLPSLCHSTIQRLQRSLEVRDRVHVALNGPLSRDAAEDALAAFDVVLLLLMGMLDAAAAVAHRVLNIPESAELAGWQHGRWLKQVAQREPALAELHQPATDHERTLTILRLLRNSVHGESLVPLTLSRHRDERTLVGLPPAKQVRLMSHFAALGGASSWGVEEVTPGMFHADAGVLIEQLLPLVLGTLNTTMDATPVEHLAHVSLRPGDLRPPEGKGYELFSERERLSVRWQLGL